MTTKLEENMKTWTTQQLREQVDADMEYGLQKLTTIEYARYQMARNELRRRAKTNKPQTRIMGNLNHKLRD